MSRKEDPQFHVIMSSGNPKKGGEPIYVYVGTPLEASEVGADLQRKLDQEDGVKSKWKRKRHVRIESPEGQIGEKVLGAILVEAQETMLALEHTKKVEGMEKILNQEEGVVIDVD